MKSELGAFLKILITTQNYVSQFKSPFCITVVLKKLKTVGCLNIKILQEGDTYKIWKMVYTNWKMK